MSEPQRMVELQTRASAPVEVDGVRITPEAQALTVSLPFFRFVWNRPVAITVERQGQSERVPIVDVTRIALLALAGSVVALAFVVRLTQGRKDK